MDSAHIITSEKGLAATGCSHLYLLIEYFTQERNNPRIQTPNVKPRMTINHCVMLNVMESVMITAMIEQIEPARLIPSRIGSSLNFIVAQLVDYTTILGVV